MYKQQERNGRRSGKGRGPMFAAITKAALDSKAYRKLPPSAAKALPYFLWKVGVLTRSALDDPKRYATTFPFTYEEAVSTGFTRSTYSKVLKDLVKYGFIDPVLKGGLRGYGQTSSLFRLSQRWVHYDTVAFQAIRWEGFRNGGSHEA